MDNYTEVRWVYYIKRKSDVAAAFTLFCRDVKQWGTVNRIRTDNGGEYTGAAFKQVEVDEVVAHEWNAPRTSQQMGKAERSWLTLKEMVRAALMHAELPDAAWERAMATAVYTRNRLPTSRHPRTTPMQSLTGKRSTHKHFKIFGALAYPHDKRYRKALAPTSEVGIFMGYDGSGYVIWICLLYTSPSPRDS